MKDLVEFPLKHTLTGVYLANTGVAEYIEVNVVKTQDEFSILKSDENLKEFDITDESRYFELAQALLEDPYQRLFNHLSEMTKRVEE